jgi:integrase
VQVNPVAQTRRSPHYDRADKRPFSTSELRAHWNLIAERPGREAAALQLHLITGGQRIEQFVRLRWADVGEPALTIFDGKKAARAGVTSASDSSATVGPCGSGLIEARGRVRHLDDGRQEGDQRSHARRMGPSHPRRCDGGFQAKRSNGARPSTAIAI